MQRNTHLAGHAQDSEPMHTDTGSDSKHLFSDGDTWKYPDPGFETDVYGFALLSILRNTFMILQDEKVFTRMSRFAHIWCFVTSQAIMYLSVFVQAATMYWARELITKKLVKEVRETYAMYQAAMYTPDGVFQPEAFHTISEEVQAGICQIALSQPMFVVLIVLIWTLQITGDLRRMWENLSAVCRMEPPSEETATFHVQLVHDPRNELEDPEDADAEIIYIRGASATLKACAILMIFLPFFAITVYTWWVGCRWLIASPTFTSFVLTAVNLGFIHEMKNIFYVAFAPAAGKRQMELTRIELAGHGKYNGGNSMTAFTASLLWGLFALSLTVLYIFAFQQVLPGYKFDVRHTCTNWVRALSSDQ